MNAIWHLKRTRVSLDILTGFISHLSLSADLFWVRTDRFLLVWEVFKQPFGSFCTWCLILKRKEGSLGRLEYNSIILASTPPQTPPGNLPETRRHMPPSQPPGPLRLPSASGTGSPRTRSLICSSYLENTLGTDALLRRAHGSRTHEFPHIPKPPIANFLHFPAQGLPKRSVVLISQVDNLDSGSEVKDFIVGFCVEFAHSFLRRRNLLFGTTSSADPDRRRITCYPHTKRPASYLAHNHVQQSSFNRIWTLNTEVMAEWLKTRITKYLCMPDAPQVQ